MKIPLVRTEGKTFANQEPSLVPERFVAMDPLQVASRSQIAKDAESLFELGSCLYFYAGHACPDFGDAVLVYEPELTDCCQGSATPFDSGGLYLGKVHATNTETAEERKQYFKSHVVPLNDWQAALTSYLGEYFTDAYAYILGQPPLCDDPTQRLKHPDNQRRAWTWEVRVEQDHPLLTQLRVVFLAVDYVEAVRKFIQDLDDDATRQAWWKRFADGQIQTTPINESVHTFAEREIATWK